MRESRRAKKSRSDRVYEMTTEKEKNEYLTSECIVTCGARGKGRCIMYCIVTCGAVITVKT